MKIKFFSARHQKYCSAISKSNFPLSFRVANSICTVPSLRRHAFSIPFDAGGVLAKFKIRLGGCGRIHQLRVACVCVRLLSRHLEIKMAAAWW
jgi:hypothetical protein